MGITPWTVHSMRQGAKAIALPKVSPVPRTVMLSLDKHPEWMVGV
jgi:hypothetical protein